MSKGTKVRRSQAACRKLGGEDREVRTITVPLEIRGLDVGHVFVKVKVKSDYDSLELRK